MVAIVTGIIVAIVVVMFVESIGHILYPIPADLDFDNTNKVELFIANQPVMAIIWVLIAWLLGIVIGILVASLIAKRRYFVISCVIGGFIYLASIANLLVIPHPTWFALLSILTIPLATLCCYKFIREVVAPLLEK